MEEEIDLRQYIAVLIKYWYWIIGLGILAALIAFIVSSFTPKTYEATALVTATQSRYELQFDPRFRNVPDSAIQSLLESQYRTYPTLAISDDLLLQLADKTGLDLDELRTSISATAQDAANLLALTVENQNPQKTAEIANTWAELFVLKANTLYGSGGELERFRQQEQSVAQSLAEADAALTAFKEENGFGFVINDESDDRIRNNDIAQFGLIGQRLQSKNQLLTDYEAELIRLHQMQREAALLLDTNTTNTSPILIAGLLSEMINLGIVKESQPFQIQLDSVDPEASLHAMATALQSRIIAIEAEMDNLRTDIATLQIELATKQEQLEQLVRDQRVKAETFSVISRKVQEAQIDVSGENSPGVGKVQIASSASVPTKAKSSSLLRNTLVAGFLGLMAGIFGVFVWEWWHNGKEEVQP